MRRTFWTDMNGMQTVGFLTVMDACLVDLQVRQLCTVYLFVEKDLTFLLSIFT
jgi:hypothetical protein